MVSGLGLVTGSGVCDDSGHMGTESVGEAIYRRRKQLLWNQEMLAKKAGVGITTVVQVEKDRDVRASSLRAVYEALDKEERKRGLRGPTLSIAPATTSQKEEGVDAVAKIRDLRLAIQRAEVFMAEAFDEIRRGLAEVATDIEESRKRG